MAARLAPETAGSSMPPDSSAASSADLADLKEKDSHDGYILKNAEAAAAQTGPEGPVGAAAGDKKQDAEAQQLTEEDKPRNYSGWQWVAVCATLYMSAFLYGLDNTIVADVQGPIVEEFGQVQKLGWAGIGFPLGSVATIMAQGKAYNYFDHKWMFLGAMVMFEAGSALCGAAPNMNALVVGRVWAGTGGGGMYLGVLNIMSTSTTMRERSAYLGVGGLFFGIGAILGPVIGGAFADSTATWRWAFYINLVIFGACCPVYLFILNPYNSQPNWSFREKLKAMDWVGVVLNSSVYTFFVLAFTFGGTQWQWSDGGTIAFIVLWAVAAVAWALQQGLALFTTKENRIFPVDFLTHRSQWFLHIGTACGATTFVIPVYYIPLYFQFVHGESGIESAVRLLPLILITVFAIMLNGVLLPAFGYYFPWYVAAGAFQIIGGALFYAAVDAQTSNARIYGYSVLLALGGGLAHQGSYSVSTAKAGAGRASDAVGFINMAQIGGIMVALTITSAIFQNVGYQNLSNAMAGQGFTPADIRAALAGQKSRVFETASPEVRAAAIDAIVDAISEGYILVIAAGALAFVTALFMKRERLFLKPEFGG